MEKEGTTNILSQTTIITIMIVVVDNLTTITADIHNLTASRWDHMDINDLHTNISY